MNNKTGTLKCNKIETFQDYVTSLSPLWGLGGQPGLGIYLVFGKK